MILYLQYLDNPDYEWSATLPLSAEGIFASVNLHLPLHESVKPTKLV